MANTKITTNVIADGAITSAKLDTNITISGNITGTLATAAQPNITSVGTLTGLTTTGDINLGDNDKAIFGAGSDLQIYHSGTNSIISEQGTGVLEVRTNGTEIQLTGNSGTDYMARFVSNGKTQLHYDGSAKLDTTSTGIDVTGTATATSLSAGSATFEGAAVNINILETNTTDVNTRLRLNSGDFIIQTLNDAQNAVTSRLAVDNATGDISFYEDTGSTAKFFWDASAESLGIGTTSPSHDLTIQKSGQDNYIRIGSNSDGYDAGVYFGTNADWSIGVDNSNSNAFSIASGSTVGTNPRVTINSSGNVGIGTSSPTALLDVTVGNAKQQNAGVWANLGKTNESSNYQALQCQQIGGSSASERRYEFQTIEQGVANAGSIVFQPSGGNVGIGTTSPSAKLTVAGGSDMGIRIISDADGYASLQFGDVDDLVRGGITYNSADDSLQLRGYNNTERMRITSSGNVGIGTGNPTYKLVLRDDSTSAYPLSLENNNIGTAGVHTGIRFGYAGGSYQKGAIIFESQDANGRGKMYFAMEGAANSSNADETDAKMTIDYSGNVGIGTSSPDTKLHVHKGSAGSVTALSDSTLVLENSTHNYLTFLSPVDKEQAIIFGDTSNNNNASVGYNHNTDNLSISSVDDIVFNTSGSTRGRFTDNGLCFNADTAAGNALDDYEEGSFTPSFNIPSGSVTYSHQEGSYTKVGSVVNIVIALGLNGTNTPSGGLSITGLPFNAGHAEKFVAAMVVALARNFNTAFDNLRGYLNNGGSSITLCINNTNTGHATPNANTLQANTQLYVSMTYNTDE